MKAFLSLIPMILVILAVLAIGYFVEYWRWQAYMSLTHQHISFWMWVFLFGSHK